MLRVKMLANRSHLAVRMKVHDSESLIGDLGPVVGVVHFGSFIPTNDHILVWNDEEAPALIPEIPFIVSGHKDSEGNHDHTAFVWNWGWKSMPLKALAEEFGTSEQQLEKEFAKQWLPLPEAEETKIGRFSPPQTQEDELL